MSKQSEHYERIGDSLAGDSATDAYRASQNHLIPSDSNYLEDVKRLQDKIINSLQHGGKREGAGRKPTGRKRQFIYVTDDEFIKVKELIGKLRQD